MKAFKVGEYVRLKYNGEILKLDEDLIEHDGNLAPFNGDYENLPETDFEHLNLKFKPFEITKSSRNIPVHENRIFGKCEGSYIRLSKYSYNFTATHNQCGYEAEWWESYSSEKLIKNFTTIEQARDWLELEYVKMMVKARESMK
jgi:hypothetical protein